MPCQTHRMNDRKMLNANRHNRETTPKNEVRPGHARTMDRLNQTSSRRKMAKSGNRSIKNGIERGDSHPAVDIKWLMKKKKATGAKTYIPFPKAR